jgi:hypothetical protein
MTLTSTDAVPSKNLSKWNRTPKGSSNFGNMRVHLFVDTFVVIVYRVASSSTKSTTLTFTDIGSQKKKIFQKWNRTSKGSLNFGNVIVHLFVDTIVTIMYRVVSSSTKSTTFTLPTSVPKNLSKWNRMPKGSSNFGNVRVYLFVGTIVTIMYRVFLIQKYMSKKSKMSMTSHIKLTDIG